MIYQEGGMIVSKKRHACGGNVWLIARTGADIKLKCSTCGRIIFLSVDQVKKITKTYVSNKEGSEVNE